MNNLVLQLLPPALSLCPHLWQKVTLKWPVCFHCLCSVVSLFSSKATFSAAHWNTRLSLCNEVLLHSRVENKDNLRFFHCSFLVWGGHWPCWKETQNSHHGFLCSDSLIMSLTHLPLKILAQLFLAQRHVPKTNKFTFIAARILLAHVLQMQYAVMFSIVWLAPGPGKGRAPESSDRVWFTKPT